MLSIVSKRQTDKNSSPPRRHDGTRSRCFGAAAPAATGHLATPREHYLKSGSPVMKPRLSPPIISPQIEIIKKLLVHAGGLLDPQRVEVQPGGAAALCFCFVCVMGENRDGGRERRSDPGRIKLSEAVGGIREITSSPLSFSSDCPNLSSSPHCGRRAHVFAAGSVNFCCTLAPISTSAAPFSA